MTLVCLGMSWYVLVICFVVVCRSHSFFFFGIQVSARVGTNKVVLSVVMKKKEHIIEESEESNKRDQQQPPGPRRLTAPAPARLLHRHRHWLRHRNRHRHRHRPRPVLGPGGPRLPGPSPGTWARASGLRRCRRRRRSLRLRTLQSVLGPCCRGLLLGRRGVRLASATWECAAEPRAGHTRGRVDQ